jgi:alanine-alpha-ketoisovalerate/valine-pyruvate aminotransferase
MLISDQQTRYLSDGALINRLAADVAAGLRARGTTMLVGGHVLPQILDLVQDPTDALRALRHPHGQSIARHSDGSTDIVLTTGIEVHIHPCRRHP